MLEQQDDIVNKVFFEKYKAIKKIGSGSFGQVYQGINIKNQESIAIKIVITYL
jgi:serine/threonine protein kinase